LDQARYAFVFGEFRRPHRMALIACYYRVGEWEHKRIMLTAHDVLLYVNDSVAALGVESGICKSEVSRICAGLEEVGRVPSAPAA
jgi:hypothetical protein